MYASSLNQSNAAARAVSLWLFLMAGLVFLMIIVGAITRLTESGLSIVEWRPLIDAVPPLTEEAWQSEFDLYKQTPEFQKKNFWMGVEDFKNIYFWEWFHRLLGRLIGLAYGLPFFFFLWRGMIPPGYRLKLFGLMLLGGFQGALGWYMVKSGLVDEPAVSHYRLAAHLGTAFLILSLLIWFGLRLRGAAQSPDETLYKTLWGVMGLLILTIFWGAYTAGLDAGLIYNEFPLMGGRFLPPDMWQYSPAWINFFENHAGVQFTHRWLAVLSVLAILGFAAWAMRRGQTSFIFPALAIMALLQMSIGIATLLTVVWLPLAVLHQAGAAVLLSLMVWGLYRLQSLISR